MMNVSHRDGGFVKKLALIVAGIGILFIVFAFAAQYVGPQANQILNQTTGSSNSSGGTGISGGQTNPLLSFLDQSGPSLGDSSYESGGSGAQNNGSRSPYANQVSLGGGSAAYSIQPYEEYVTLRNSGQRAVNITGWVLTNGKGTRPIQTSSNSYIYPANESAVIGQGTTFLNPSGVFQIGPVILNPGDNAIVTTGLPFSQFPYSIYTNFKENICDGYLINYPFTPSLEKRCPYLASDPDIRTVTSQCYDYMRSLSTCEDPERDDKANFDEQTSQCKAFMTARSGYSQCVALHGNDQSFTRPQWRIFLGKTREMWASQRETITLYDSSGLIVDQIQY